MNVYSYLELELKDRGWSSADNGQSVFYEHHTIEKLLEPLHTGDINVLNLDYEEIDLIKRGDLDRLDAL